MKIVLLAVERFRMTRVGATGVSRSMIIISPVKIPADLRQAMARPIMKAVEIGAASQSADPASNTTIESRKTHFVE